LDARSITAARSARPFAETRLARRDIWSIDSGAIHVARLITAARSIRPECNFRRVLEARSIAAARSARRDIWSIESGAIHVAQLITARSTRPHSSFRPVLIARSIRPLSDFRPVQIPRPIRPNRRADIARSRLWDNPGPHRRALAISPWPRGRSCRASARIGRPTGPRPSGAAK